MYLALVAITSAREYYKFIKEQVMNNKVEI
jgi:hypothetical protein